jgi:hypothetical protein
MQTILTCTGVCISPPQVHDEADPSEEDGNPAGPPLLFTWHLAARIDEEHCGNEENETQNIVDVTKVAQPLMSSHKIRIE